MQRAASAYEPPDPAKLQGNDEVSGLPWGGLSIKHVVEAGKAKQERDSLQASRESSTEIRPQAALTRQ